MCLECDKFFEDARYLRNHLRAVHDNIDRSRCTVLQHNIDRSRCTVLQHNIFSSSVRVVVKCAV